MLINDTRQNAAVWDNMSSEERERYVAENKDLGNKRYAAQSFRIMRINTNISPESTSAFCIKNISTRSVAYVESKPFLEPKTRIQVDLNGLGGPLR